MKRTLGVQHMQNASRILSRKFYMKNSVELAKALLGKVLTRKLPSGELLRGTIVETEAYPGSEEAKMLNVHCFITKETEKNSGIFKDPGTTWVYMTYGVFNMINISAMGPGSACLIRAIEPKDDAHLDLMQRLRTQKKSKKEDSTVVPPVFPTSSKPSFKTYELGNGPGKLCKVLSIDREMCNLVDLTSSDFFWVEENDSPEFEDGKFEIISATRIGIDSAPEKVEKIF